MRACASHSGRRAILNTGRQSKGQGCSAAAHMARWRFEPRRALVGGGAHVSRAHAQSDREVLDCHPAGQFLAADCRSDRPSSFDGAGGSVRVWFHVGWRGCLGCCFCTFLRLVRAAFLWKGPRVVRLRSRFLTRRPLCRSCARRAGSSASGASSEAYRERSAEKEWGWGQDPTHVTAEVEVRLGGLGQTWTSGLIWADLDIWTELLLTTVDRPLRPGHEWRAHHVPRFEHSTVSGSGFRVFWDSGSRNQKQIKWFLPYGIVT